MENKKIVFVKSSDLKDCELKGVLEVEVIKVDFTGDVCSLIAPNGKLYYSSLSSLFANAELTHKMSASQFSSSSDCGFFNHNGKTGYTLIDGVGVEGEAKLLVWDKDPENSVIEVNDHIIDLKDLSCWYDDLNDFQKCESITLHKLDGTTEKMHGEFAKYMVTDEQTALLEELESVLQKCSDAKIKLAYDSDYGDMFAINDPDDDIVSDEPRDNNDIPRCIQYRINSMLYHLSDYWCFCKRK